MITQALTNFVFRSVAPKDIRYIETPDPDRMEKLATSVYRQMLLEFQTVPPVTLHHPLPRVMAGLWAASREAYVADHAGRSLREAVGASVSQINQCPYCVDVHVAMLYGLGDGHTAQALAEGDVAGMDEATRKAVEWAAATLSPGADILRHPPFSAAEAPRIIGTALLFHYLNRMVHLFLPDSPLPIPSSLGWLKRNAGALFGKTVGSKVAMLVAGDDSFPLADEPAELPEEFRWARGDARVAAAFALFAKVAEEAGLAHIDAEVRRLVVNRIGQWQGEQPGLGRAWLEQAVAALADEQKPAARLALLTALASYQVTDLDVAAFRTHASSDAALVGLAAWASYQAMKRISGWLHAPGLAFVTTR